MVQSLSPPCEVCGQVRHALATLCTRCKKLVDRVDMRRRPDKAARQEALRQAWDGSAFRCYYTGIALEEAIGSPLYPTWDHRTPGDEEDVVLCAALINDMKSDLTESEFRAIVLGLAGHFQGQPMDGSLFSSLARWKR